MVIFPFVEFASIGCVQWKSYASARTNSRESCARLGTGSFDDFMGKLDNLIDDNSPTLASVYDGATLKNESNTSDFQSSSGNSTVTTTTTMDRFFDDATLKNASGNTTVTTTTTTTTTEKSSDVLTPRQISNMSVDDDDENSKASDSTIDVDIENQSISISQYRPPASRKSDDFLSSSGNTR